MWARNELAQRWRALIVLGLIAGVAAGLALGAVVQARRSATVYSRFRTATAAPDAIVFGTQVNFETPIDYRPVLKLPEVTAAGQFNLAPVGIKEFRDTGGLPTDDNLYRTLARPLLRQGRLPRAGSDNEIVVNELAAKRHHIKVGQRVTLISSNDLNAFFGTGKMEGGPTTAATVVGIGNTPLDFIFTIDEPAFVAGGAVLSKHPEIPKFPNLVVRLKPGTVVSQFHLRAAKALGLPDIPVRDLAQERKRFVHGTDLERTALLLFAAAVVLAGLVLVGQALARSVYAMGAQASTLSALGVTRRELIAGLVMPTVLTAVVAAASAVGVAIALSGRFPVGLSRQLEPHLGTHVDGPVLAVGAFVVVLLVLGGAALAGLRATGPRRSSLLAGRGIGVLAGIRAVAPLPVSLGATLALEPGRGPRSTPVRPALAGAVAGIIGIVGALGLVRGIDDSLRDPRRSGQVWDSEIVPDDAHSTTANLALVRKEPLVEDIAILTRRPLDVNGDGLPVYSLQSVRGNNQFVTLTGRRAVGADEVALGPASLKALHKHLGDRILIGAVPLRIVGTTLLEQTPHSSFDQGAWVSPSGLARLPAGSDNGVDVEVAVTAKHGVTRAALDRALRKRLPGVEIGTQSLPQDVVLLRNVRTLPRVLAAFLGLLGIAALGHALVTAVRRRSHDLAVMRALGFRPGQNAATIIWQATTVAVIGLVVGLPLGIATGRVSWQWVANSTPLLYVAPIAGVAIALAVPGTLAIANGLAALPARRAARLRAVDILRTE
ncbi:MAG: putative transport system permease protein [Actinomycetota bacterium]|nr:putative transport system permease protein [Actinomycetota bacterium]